VGWTYFMIGWSGKCELLGDMLFSSKEGSLKDESLLPARLRFEPLRSAPVLLFIPCFTRMRGR
jgi:hypothetical protein